MTDSSKPFYEQPYFEKVKKALKPDGIMCSLGTALYTHNVRVVTYPFQLNACSLTLSS